MKIEGPWVGMKFAVIEEIHEKPPCNQVVESFDTFEEVRVQVCAAIFSQKIEELSKEHREEFEGYMSQLADEGRISFEGDPGISVGLYSPPREKKKK